MISFSASNAMNDFDPVGATSPQKCSESPRSALVGLNFLSYNGWLHHDLHLRLLPRPFSYGRKRPLRVPFLSLSSLGSWSQCFLLIFCHTLAFRPKFSLTVSTRNFQAPYVHPTYDVTKRSRPSMASYLRDSDEPILISTTFPKKARPTTPPTSLRTTSTSLYSSSTSTSPAIPLRTSDATLNTLTTDRPLVGLLVKLNGEEIPFLIPRPTLPFRLPEAAP